MRQSRSVLVRLRHRAGKVRAFLDEHAFGVSRSIVFEAACCSRHSLLYEASRDGQARAKTGPQIAFRFGDVSDVLAFTPDAHEYGDAEKRFSMERLKRGDSLLIGESGGQTVFYAWLMLGKMDLDMNIEVPLVREAAYSYKVFTVEGARGTGVCSAYYRHIKQWLQQLNYSRLVCRIAPGNAPSIRAHARAGFRSCGRLWTFRTPGHELFYADARLRAWLPTIVSGRSFSPRGVLLESLRLSQAETRMQAAGNGRD